MTIGNTVNAAGLKINHAPVIVLEMILLLAILFLAAFLRLGSPGVVEFKRDEANLSRLALDLAHGRSLPLLGISSSVGVPNSPMSVYIFALPYLFSSDPAVATQYVGILNVLAVLLTYLVVRRYYGVGAALLAVLLYAVSPWGVIYSRKVWAQDVLPPFVVATFFAGLLGFVEGKRWAQWLFLPLLCITAQIHYSAVLLAIPAVYLIWIGRPRWTRAFFLSFIPAVLLAVPFLMGVLRADLPTLDELRTLTAASSPAESRSLGLTGQMLHYAALTIAGTEIHSLAGPQAFQNYLAGVPDAYPLFGLLAWGVLLAAFWLIFRIWKIRDGRRPIDALLLIWLVIPVAAFSITWTELYPHYLILMMPAAYIVLGLGAADLWNALSSRVPLGRMIFAAAGVLVVAIVSLQILLWTSLVNFLATNNTPDGFGTPLQNLTAVRDSLLARRPSQVVARLDGQFVGADDDATVWDVLLYEVPTVRFLDADTNVYPVQPAAFLTRTCDPSQVARLFPLRSQDEGCYRVSDEMPLVLRDDIVQPLTTESSFTNGVRIVGYQWTTGEIPCLHLAWSIAQTTTEDYSFSVHFLNAAGQEIVNADGLSWRGVYWRPGDIVFRRFCLTGDHAARQSEISGVNVGMYTYDGVNFHNVDLLDSNGTPVGQTVSIPFES